MATSIRAHPLAFQRGERNFPIKKIRSKSSPKIWQIILVLLLVCLVLFAIRKICSFLVSWEKLEIKNIRLSCEREEVREQIAELLHPIPKGNILLFDISSLQKSLEKHPWVREARIRKIFPSTLLVEIKERIPFAILKKYHFFYLIDEEGVQLESVASGESFSLPLLLDEENFERNFPEKLKMARQLLANLPAEKIMRVESLDLSGYETLVLKFKDMTTKIILGNGPYAEKLKTFEINWPQWESLYGPFEYIDLRLPDRLTFKPAASSNPEVVATPAKEEQ